ncbi:MAG TPA: 4Fe-4S dicluster domain-containing protein [Pyrodictium sp.]|nr:4Fe-4S dicluster domain-containing protein [Pyrodictium sp.]
MTIQVLVDEACKEHIPFNYKVFTSPQELVEHAVEALWNNTRILLVCRGAWRLWRQVKERAWRAGLNWLLVEAVDPLEAEIAGVDLEAVVEARYRSLAESSVDRAVYRSNLRKPVDRRTLFSVGPLALLEYVDAPTVDLDVCSVARGCRNCVKACPRKALEGKPPHLDSAKCIGCGYCVTVCPVSALELPSTPKKGLWEQTLLYLRAGTPFIVFACRDSMAELLERLDASVRVGIVPVGSPIGVSLDILLAVWGLGAKPLLYCANLPKEALKVYRDSVGEDYRVATGERLEILSSIRQLLKVLKMVSRLGRGGRVIELVKDARKAALQVLATIGKKVWLNVPLIGLVSVNADNCTLCGVCVTACPTGALSLEEQGESRKLVFRHENCTSCRACVEVCPETTIAVNNVFSPEHFGKTVVVVEAEIARCKVCGRPLEPRKMVERVVERLKEFNMPKTVVEEVYMCDKCKLKAALDAVRRASRDMMKRKS